MSSSFVALALMLYAAQAPPPIPGTTGTLALEGSVDKVYAGAHSAVVTAGDGVKHLIHFTDRTVVHGDHDPRAPLDSLKEGSRVVVHYTMDGTTKAAVEIDRIGAGGLSEAQGVVTRIDHQAQRLSIRLADGTTETLQLSDRAAALDAGRGLEHETEGAKVVVYYTDEAGNKIAHYFKRVE